MAGKKSYMSMLITKDIKNAVGSNLTVCHCSRKSVCNICQNDQCCYWSCKTC